MFRQILQYRDGRSCIIAPDVNLAKFIVLLILFTGSLNAKISFMAVGDVMLDRGVANRIKLNGQDYPYEKIRKILSNSDYAMCNFESPSADDSVGHQMNKPYSFNTNHLYVKSLGESGFNLANLANNHSIDRGKAGLTETVNNLEQNNIVTIGAGNNQNEAFHPAILEKDGITIAVFGYLGFMPEDITYSETEPFAAYGNFDKFCENIKRYKEKVNFAIVTFHWGKEDNQYPNSKQSEMAHKAIEAGADLVIGHHPHVLQSIEIYNNKIILYSLGNFIFDNNTGKRSESAIFSCDFNKNAITNYKLIPVRIENSRPVLADSKLSKAIFNKIKDISSEYNTIFIFKNNEIIIQNKKTGNLPLYRYDIKSNQLLIYKNKIQFISGNRTLSEFNISEKHLSVYAAQILNINDTLYIYSILENKIKRERNLAIFIFDLKNDQFFTPYYDTHKSFYPWKIFFEDIDNDGKPELIAGCRKKTRYDKVIRNRLLILNIDHEKISTKWFGSKVGTDFIDFEPHSEYGRKYLNFINRDNNKFITNLFRWSGFGLEFYKKTNSYINIDLARKNLYKNID